MSKTGEIGKASVCGQDQDEHCGELRKDEHGLSESAAPVDRVSNLGDNSFACHWDGFELRRKPRNAEEHERQHCAHDHEG